MVWQFDILLLFLVVVLAILAITFKDLLLASVVLGAYSFLMALIWSEMGAVDVAFTEASVGAGVSTIFLIIGIYQMTRYAGSDNTTPFPSRLSGTNKQDVKSAIRSIYSRTAMVIIGVLIILLAAGLLFYGVWEMPTWADPCAPSHLHPAPIRYIEQPLKETATPNMVTAILADYRGYDTLGETTVIFIAGITCLLLLLIPKRDKGDKNAG